MGETIPVVFNPRSGGGDTRADAISSAFASHGLDVRLHALAGDAGDERLLDEAATAPRVVAGGGDGTIGSVAARLCGSDGRLGVLPLGTRNHFARDVGIPLALEDAVAAIAGGHSRSVDLGEVTDGAHAARLFLNNASLGLYTRFALCRENERERPGWALWPALIKSAWRALRTSRDLDLELVVDGQRIQRRTPVLLVGNNVYDLQGLDRGQRPRLDAGVLSVVVLRPRSRMALAWFGLRALVGAVSSQRDFDTISTDELVVHARHATLDVALDGEPHTLATPLRFRSRPRALRVCVPPDDQEAA